MSFPKKKKPLDAWLVKKKRDGNSQKVESEHNIISPNSSVTDTESHEETDDVNKVNAMNAFQVSVNLIYQYFRILVVEVHKTQEKRYSRS